MLKYFDTEIKIFYYYYYYKSRVTVDRDVDRVSVKCHMMCWRRGSIERVWFFSGTMHCKTTMDNGKDILSITSEGTLNLTYETY